MAVQQEGTERIIVEPFTNLALTCPTRAVEHPPSEAVEPSADKPPGDTGGEGEGLHAVTAGAEGGPAETATTRNNIDGDEAGRRDEVDGARAVVRLRRCTTPTSLDPVTTASAQARLLELNMLL